MQKEFLLFEKLRSNADSILALVSSASEEQVLWRPSETSWSLLEVMNHLYEEEFEDFRRRVDFVLNPEGKEWHAIDPEGWVKARDYQGRDWAETLENFSRERQKSLEWLESQKEKDWNASYTHKKGWVMTMTAKGLLAAWHLHDLLHLRQILRLEYEYLQAKGDTENLRYAGDW